MIKLVRLVSGEEIIGNVTETFGKDGDVIIKNPFIVIPTADGKISCMQFMPYSTASEEFTVKQSSVMFIVEPAEQLAEYVKQMSSEIITPQKQGIIL